METERRPQKKGWGSRLGMGCLLILVLLIGGVLTRRLFQKIDGPPIPPQPQMPVPNAADTFQQAALLLKNSGSRAASLDSPKTPLRILRNLVKTNRQVLSLFRQGLGKPCQYPGTNLHSVVPSYPFMEEIRLAKLVVAEGRVYEAEKNWRAAADSYLDAYEFGSVHAPKSALTCKLAGTLCEALATVPLYHLLDRCDTATAAHIRDRLQGLYARSITTADLMSTIKDEQLLILYEWGHGQLGEETFVLFPARQLVSMSTQAILSMTRQYYLLNERDCQKQITGYYDRLIENVKKPFYKRSPYPAPPLQWTPIGFFFAAVQDFEHKKTQAKSVMVKAALRAYAGAHNGVYPATLSSLPLKPEEIADPYRNAPFVYSPPVRKKGNNFPLQIYSVGENGKDDGGVNNYRIGADDIVPE